ncbi:transport and Golgi organization protein 1 homolog isoform X1 [Mirounga angustirostris]|uniref:transport and Golgi organization protein 1 homolog isoform X1 n=1 Tax=Mirounga angustirostris TaxID=9716 RepID=UPI00313DDB8B
MKVQRLLFLVLLLRCPGSPNPNVPEEFIQVLHGCTIEVSDFLPTLVHVVPDRFLLGPDGVGVLWKLPIITAPLGVCVFLIYIWRTILAIKPRRYEVTLQQINEKIHRLRTENRELAQEISLWELKIREGKKHVAETKSEHKFLSEEVLKLKENIEKVDEVNENLNDTLRWALAHLQIEREKKVKNQDVAQDAFEDGEQRAFRAKKRELQECRRLLEDHCNALSSLKTTQEAELKMLRRKVDIVVDFSKQRQAAAEEKVAKTRCDLEATESQLSAAMENLKGITEATDKYKQEIGEMQDQLQEAELTFQHKIAAHERSALDNWIKAQVWERKIVQQRRENAYVKHRLHMMRREMLPEGSMRQEPMPGRPETQNRVQRGLWSDAETGGSPMGNRGTEPHRDPGMSKVGTDVRGFPHAPRPPHMPYHMGQGLPGFPGYGPPPPPPHGWTWGPQPQLIPATHGLRSYSETCGSQGDNSGTPPKKVPQKD